MQVKHNITHHISTTVPPVFARAQLLSQEKLLIARKQFEQMLELGIVRSSASPWAQKKINGDWKPCGDYRALSNITKPDRYPIPHTHDFSASLHGAQVFSTTNLTRAYHQLPVNPADIPKNAVITPFGPYEFIRMPFSLKNEAQTFID